MSTSDQNESKPKLWRASAYPCTSFLSLAVVVVAFSTLLYIHALLHETYTPLGVYEFRYAGLFALKDSYVGQDFFNRWDWETINDPTHGRVNYVSQTAARSSNLSYASETKFIMRADDFNTVSPSARGRNSIRITSQITYEESLIVLDLQHMPEGCATWPAFWTLSKDGPWPHGGEIDIVEGVNLDTRNLASLHTTENCGMPQQRFQSGETTSTNCDARVNSNQGCGVSFSKAASYGAPFNAAGGGFFVMRRTRADGVAVWFWSRNDPNVPPEVRGLGGAPGGGLVGDLVVGVAGGAAGGKVIESTPLWGLPEAVFPPQDCDADHFNAHMMIFDLTFCGDWAGSVWPASGCGFTSCSSYVDHNPSAFSNAYWEVNSIRVYTPV